MAVVCVLALAFVLLLPLTQSRGEAGADLGGQRTTQGIQAKAAKCQESTVQDQSPPPSDADGTTINAIKQRGYLNVGVDQNSYRWGYLNPNSSGELEGFDIDLVHAIAKNIFGSSYSPSKVHLLAIPTDQRIPAIQKKRVDMVVRTMTINCERAGKVAFSAPYFVTGQQVLAPKVSTITGYNDTLARKRVCSAATSIANTRLHADKGHKIPATVDILEPVPNQLDCLVELQLGQADAVVTDGALAASQAAQDPTVELKGAPFTTEYYGVAMNKSATDLVQRVNRILETYRTSTGPDGWHASYTKWLLPTLRADSTSADPPTPHYK
ncbi:glutamate ABC transporter substrate-binding protein [Streptomyces prunicolor]|uniref:Glutamate ABC transporter substrate-binding protein n=2 Tax=Streptomyces prunicolor TaxID=67348 RepID=A0ABU4FS57_9ACTN|nr:glutamate ABC transporter substrate-binding protein [Streptomyces prunicolor]MDV7223374.1 glutamate ABC transporter substrate-binding protein [Streptomyces prunicolor]